MRRLPELGSTALALFAVACGGSDPDPSAQAGTGPTDLGLRPLTADEVDHAVQDLLGIEWSASALLPASVQDGYATDVNAGSLDPLRVESMLAVASATAAAVFTAPPRHTVRVEAEDLEDDWDLELATESPAGSVWVGTFRDRRVRALVDLPVQGRWRISFHVGLLVDDFLDREDQGDPLVDRAWLDGESLPPMVLREQGTGTPPFVVERTLSAGRHVLEFEQEVSRGQTPIVDAFEFQLSGSAPRALADLRDCSDQDLAARPACVGALLRPLARVAWRRPVDGQRMEALQAVVDREAERSTVASTQATAGLEAILASPDFWLLVEGGRGVTEGGVYHLSSHEVATRLALFLWSSLPDEQLLDCADQGGLQATDPGPCGLEAQVDRMLDDARATRLVTGFAMAWLGLGRLDSLHPDPGLFPELDPARVDALREETRLVLEEILLGGAPLDALVSSDFTWVDQTLADHYGLPSPPGLEDATDGTFVRVTTDEQTLGGALRTGAVLLATAHPSRSSDVRRGVLLLSALGCEPPAPPPPNVQTTPGTDVREGLLEQTSRPPCSQCHDQLNPWGLALAAQDIAGRPTGEAPPDLSAFDYPVTFPTFADFAARMQEGDRATSCFTRHLTSWAVGRSLDSLPSEDLELVARATRADGNTFRAAVHAVARSAPFLTRAGEEP